MLKVFLSQCPMLLLRKLFRFLYTWYSFLAFSPYDFIMWLGILLFPLLPLCTCLSAVDQLGDHLLGCSHGPFQHHNPLVSVLLIHLVFFMKRVPQLLTFLILEIFSYHPNFCHGYPAYFDFSVRCTTESALFPLLFLRLGWLLVLVRKLKTISTWREFYSNCLLVSGHHLHCQSYL